MTESIAFVATVAKLYTMCDGGLRVVFDLPETAIMAAAELLECKRVGVALQVTCEPEMQVGAGGKTRDIQTRAKRKSEWETAEK